MLAKWLALNVPVIQCRWCFTKGQDGFATPLFVVVKDKTDIRDILHERAHVYQWWRGWIVGFAIDYVIQLTSVDYDDIDYEIYAKMYQHGIIMDIEETWPKL